MSEVVRTLADKGQQLPFEPADHRVLLGSTGEPTIGAVVAANISGPRRIMAGAARDSLIGVRFVNGRGEAIKSGGRVMKNVTGLDLVKLMAGSWGTLGFLTEVTFKVLPIPERSATLVFPGLDDGRAVEALCAAVGSPFETSGAAHLPAAVAGGGARTLIRLEGFSTSVEYRLGELRRLLRAYGAPAIVEGEAAEVLWRAVRDVTPLTLPRDDGRVARLDRADARAGTRGRDRPGGGRALVLRLGRRARLGRDRREGRRRRRGGPRRGQAAWRQRHPRARAGRGARRRRRVRALARAADADHERHQGGVRSGGHAQSGTDVCGSVIAVNVMAGLPPAIHDSHAEGVDARPKGRA